MAKQKMAVVCNGDTPANIMPTLIFSTSGVALDYDVHVFVDRKSVV
jgi:peroxiredoxin family protein